MIIWFALGIPIAITLFVCLKYQRKIVWWEVFVPTIVCMILIFFCKWGVEKLQTNDTEYWGGWIQKAEYYEYWDEEVPCRHPIEETDKDGNTRVVGYEHMYDVDEHPPYWQVIDSNGITITVDENKFEFLAKRFGNRDFVELNRHYHSKDGDKYEATWNGKEKTFEPSVTAHTYENRLQASTSVFKFEKVDPKKYNLFEYPKIVGYYYQPSILGPNTDRGAMQLFDNMNARLGAKRQLKIWVLIFVDKPLEAGFEQQSYWKNGNKNEFVIAIGINPDREIQWAHIFSWSENESLKTDTRNYIIAQKRLDLVNLAGWIKPELEKRYKRKSFADFNYLTVEPPLWAVILTFILTALASLVSSVWIIGNNYTNERFQLPWRY